MKRKPKFRSLETGYIKTADKRTYFVDATGVRRRTNDEGAITPRPQRVLGISRKSLRRKRIAANNQMRRVA